jgi:hypothetical protein
MTTTTATIKVFAGYIQAEKLRVDNQRFRIDTETRPIFICGPSREHAMSRCQQEALERLPKTQGWKNHHWDLTEAEGVTIGEIPSEYAYAAGIS